MAASGAPAASIPRCSAALEFDLPSGSYATALLREVLRCDTF
jgi:tRNA(Glu) U13 pseudouridine synthase TruD